MERYRDAQEKVARRLPATLAAGAGEKDEAYLEEAYVQRDEAIESLVDVPVETLDQLARKFQIGADRYFCEMDGESFLNPDWVAKVASESTATYWFLARLYQDIERLAKAKPPRIHCEVENSSDWFAEALRRYNFLDTRLTAHGDAQKAAHAEMERAVEVGQAHTPQTRAGVAYQLLLAAGEIDTVENGSTDEYKSEAGERIRVAICNAIRTLGLPFDYQTAEHFLGDRLADLDGSARPGPTR